MSAASRPMRLLVASANPHKVAELRVLLCETLPDVELVLRPPGVPDVDETSDTLEGNARLKAAALVRATGLAAVADDTGLFVAALGGLPGVHTARYAGVAATAADNRTKLLGALRSVAVSYRCAEFRTVVVVVRPDGSELSASGSVKGHISGDERGGGGFGYDSIFVPAEGDGRTFAEMEDAEKHALSHRGRAIRALATLLRSP